MEHSRRFVPKYRERVIQTALSASEGTNPERTSCTEGNATGGRALCPPLAHSHVPVTAPPDPGGGTADPSPPLPGSLIPPYSSSRLTPLHPYCLIPPHPALFLTHSLSRLVPLYPSPRFIPHTVPPRFIPHPSSQPPSRFTPHAASPRPPPVAREPPLPWEAAGRMRAPAGVPGCSGRRRCRHICPESSELVAAEPPGPIGCHPPRAVPAAAPLLGHGRSGGPRLSGQVG